MKTFLHILVVIVTGSLLGSFFNKIVTIWFPQGNINNLVNTSINTGLNPTTIDLNVIQFTLGLIFKFNIATIAGIFVAAILYKQLVK